MTSKSELEVVAAIESKMGNLVELANQIIDDVMPKVKALKTDLTTQLRNAMAIANASPHPLVLTSFIGYQMGRQTTSRAWKETGLGDRLIKAIEGDVQGWAAEAAGEEGSPGVQMRMARLLLGFMSRRWVHKKEKQERQR